MLAPLRHGEPERLGAIDDILALAHLPESVRRWLVLTCGSGVPPYYSNGRGVFRLTGSRRHALGILEQVKTRVSSGAPWILQAIRGRESTGSSPCRPPMPRQAM